MRAVPKAASACPSDERPAGPQRRHNRVKTTRLAHVAQRPAYTVLSGPVAFERVLKGAPVARTRLFALHQAPSPGLDPAPEDNLSTSSGQPRKPAVDNCRVNPRLSPNPTGLRVGLVVPKRLAARAVTRNFVKRRARTAVQAAAGELAQGDWVLRLRAPLPSKTFTSAASDALARTVTQELDDLFAAWRRHTRSPTRAHTPQREVTKP